MCVLIAINLIKEVICAQLEIVAMRCNVTYFARNCALISHIMCDLLIIQKLTKGSDSWSLSELVHAIVILAHFHALSSFVFGCNISTTDGHTCVGNNGDEKENGHNRVNITSGTDNNNSNNGPPSPTSLG